MSTTHTVHLQINATYTGLTVVSANAPKRELLLPVGWQNLFSQRDGLGVPTPLAIEQGIQAVEDALETVHKQLPVGARFVLDAALLTQLGVTTPASLEIDLNTVEAWYQSLAARSVGAPSASGSGFVDPAGDGFVLILREAMHHLNFEVLHIETTPTKPITAT